MMLWANTTPWPGNRFRRTIYSSPMCCPVRKTSGWAPACRSSHNITRSTSLCPWLFRIIFHGAGSTAASGRAACLPTGAYLIYRQGLKTGDGFLNRHVFAHFACIELRHEKPLYAEPMDPQPFRNLRRILYEVRAESRL